MTLVSLCFAVGAWAQEITVTGKVIDKSGEPLIGVYVLLQGSTSGTSTDVDGNYALTVPSGATLQFSLIGYRVVAIPVNGKGVINVTLEEDAVLLDDVVVTAMGISRSEKALGYAASTVKSEELLQAKSGSLMSGMAGKVAGLNISTSAGAGSSQKVIIRGISSLNSNTPLYIIDGVPIDNNTIGRVNGADFGNSANNINPEDVESVTVLKGASATALYGSRASNGVIMITTKKADKDDRLTVTYDAAFTATTTGRVMKTQDLFGQGWGSWDRAENGSWGPRLTGIMHEWGSDGLETPLVKPFTYVKDNLKNFYKTGTEINNSIRVQYGTKNAGIVTSFSNANSNGILPNDGDKFGRNTFFLRGYANYKKLHVDMSINYTRTDIRRTDGMYMELLQHATDIDMSLGKDYNDPAWNLDNYYTFYAYNPYWMIDNFKYEFQGNMTRGTVELKYDIIPGLQAIGRFGGDFSSNQRLNKNAEVSFTPGSYSDLGGATPVKGYYSEMKYTNTHIDATAMLSANYKIGENFNISGMAGWNLNQLDYSYTGASVSELEVPDWYSLLNTSSAVTVSTYNSRRRLIGAFAQAELAYKDFLYLNLSARNDWSSTLPVNNNSFFYGGANVSLLLNNMIPSLKDAKFDLLKVRLAAGQTGNDAGVYMTYGTFRPTQVGYTYLPIAGAAGLTEYNTKPSTTLKPEITTEWEVGISGAMFQNRLTFDFAYYDKVTKDQIISATLPTETGYTSETKNVGKLGNKGIEAAISVTPIRKGDWEWEVGVTFAKNNSKVIELWDGLEEYSYTNSRGVYYVLREGGPIGEFRIPAVAKVTDKNSPYYGYEIVNNNGWYNTDATSYEYLGCSQADFTLGFTTNLRWKDLSFSMVGDWRKGGNMYSETAYISHFNGNSTQTVYNERDSYIIPHTVKVVNGEYVENNIPVKANQMNYAQGNYSYNQQLRRHFVLPRDYFKIREIALSYNLPSKLIQKTFLKQITVSAIGRNLFLGTPERNNYVDPEASNLGNDLLSEFGESGGTISTKNYGFGLKVVF
ncbi:MAG: SusC/RagA family TonB-linked outer membrane protein [Bacteroidales bacterium]|nr:SusC/RagA family TonB-linked outer membrane protein [Bacteroidales bacterium]